MGGCVVGDGVVIGLVYHGPHRPGRPQGFAPTFLSSLCGGTGRWSVGCPAVGEGGWEGVDDAGGLDGGVGDAFDHGDDVVAGFFEPLVGVSWTMPLALSVLM